MMELMLVMLILSLFFPLMVRLTHILASRKMFPSEVQDQIGLAQLRRFLNSCPVVELSAHELVCENEKEWHLRCSDHHLFLSDGTMIVLEGISEVLFEIREREIWMMYQRNHVWKEALITYA